MNARNLTQIASQTLRDMTVLIVDDDPVQRRILEGLIEKFGYASISVEDGEKAVTYIQSEDGDKITAIILDIVMPNLDGLGVLEKLARLGKQKPTIVQTSQGGIDTVISAMRAGASDFVVKPASPERLRISLENVMMLDALGTQLQKVKRSVEGSLTFDNVITNAERMEKVIDLGTRAAKSNIPVLLEGESGVGKELIARAIHGSSLRKSQPLITVNCGAIPENLVESILFGHEKGAFTGATEKRSGKFQDAHNGTLFLDEVGELPFDMQVKLLRAIQEGEIDPVGASKPVKVNIRLISATNKSLLNMVEENSFREDLFYRLNVFPIWIPPLRERMNDIAPLARHFATRFAAEEGRKHIRGISPDAMQLLQAYDWPGNIRQLENTLFRATVLCDGIEITPTDIPQIATKMGQEISQKSNTFHSTASSYDPSDPNIIGQEHHHFIENHTDIKLLNENNQVRRLNHIEADIIRKAHAHYKGHMSDIARALGIGRSTLYRKMKDYGIAEKEAPPS